MKKPTFSNLTYWLLPLFENIFQTVLGSLISKENILYSLRNLVSQSNRFSRESSRAIVLLLFFFLQSSDVLGQTQVNFSPRFDKSIKGDMLLIGNNILSTHVSNDFNNSNTQNNNQTMVFVDVDGDSNTFNSSSAKLDVPSNTACYKIVYAGLYWSAVVKGDENSPNTKITNTVKFKVPNGNYVDITGTTIYESTATANNASKPYASYADVTSYLQALSNPEGDYFVANVSSKRGTRTNTEGFSAGWSLFVVYEDPNLPAKYITSFDGFNTINPSNNLTLPVSGFKTIPVGPVRAKYAFSALEGDKNLDGDYLEINGTKISATNNASTTIRPVDNFFNSSISYIDTATNTPELFTTRTPKSSNTLGFDAGILNIPNPATTAYPGGSLIKNGDTSATIKLGSDIDIYYFYFNAFAVDIIEPKIVLTKIVKNTAGAEIGNQNVTLGQILNYEIGIQNKGNDKATSLTIRDILPINTIFNYPADASSIVLPTGVTVKSYNAATREIVFDVDSSIVEVGDGVSTIKLKVQVVPSCNMLSDACSNSIDNQAFATYKGTLNTAFTISDDPSINTNTGCILIPKATNFLVGIDDCQFTKNEVLCGNSVVITASNGYSSYKWSTAPFDNNGNTTGTIIGNNKTLTVTNPGIYYVYNTAVAPCLSITEAVTVSRFGGVATNPVIPFADRVVTCPNDGKSLPNIFLCGLNATKIINTNISDGSTIVWEKLNEASCTAVTNEDCANESLSCTWTQVGTGPSYTANTSGQFRLTLNYPGGCFNRFYFNVYQNLLNPTETHRDIVCTTNGNITVGGVPTGYEYSISNVGGTTPTTYGTSNSFTITSAGLYTVFIRQIGVTTNPCIFTIPNIQIRQRNFTVTNTVTQPLCFGEKGIIKAVANDVEPQYYYKIFNGGTLVNSVGPIAASDYTFSNLTPGITYQVQVTTQDGCSNDQWIYIQQPTSAVTAAAAIVEPLTSCNDGKIVITPQGGTGPYYYFINGSSTFQTSNEIVVKTPGQYDIEIVDNNNCRGTASVTVPNNAKPTYTVSNTNNSCYGNGAQITIGNIVANGYTMSYSIDNGATFGTNPIFPNLYPGTYNVVVKYTISYMSQWNGMQTKTCQDPPVQVIITGPSSAVTASAGVGELAGCGPLQGGQPTGLLRITNVEGGTAPYQYSYDGGNTWEGVSQKYVIAGTYSLAVKDALGCTFLIPYSVILDPKPADPLIDNNLNTIYNCDGTATATVVVNNPPTSGGTTYTYEYYLQLNGTGAFIPNSPLTNNVFLNVPSGSHNVKVKYNVNTVSSYSNLLREDFGRGGDTSSPGINAAYCREDQDGNTMAFATCSLSDWHPWLMNDGDYVVTKGLLQDHFNDFNWWLPKDNTAVLNNTPAITDGRFLAVNIGATIPIGAVLYSKPINDVLPNQEINVSLYMTNLLKASNNLPSPKLRVQLVKNGTVIASVAMPDIPRDEKWHFSTTLTGSVLTLNPGNNTSLDFQILSDSQVVTGNDLAIDDIHVYQIPKSCGNEREFPVIIDGSKAFKASIPTFTNVTCSGGNNGTITISAENFGTAGYQYKLDNNAFITTTTSPLVLTGLGVGSHTIIVRSDATGTCSYTLTQAITAPTAVTVTASVTTPPTCTTGATITAVGDGGTPAYQYELRQSNGITVVTAFQTNAQFTEVPVGNYTVFARDSNSCISAVGASVNVAPLAPVTATLASTSDLCYDTVNRATLVVTATGTGTLTYSLDGQAAQNDNTFTNVAPGTHNIVVTDSNNCTATISNIVIANALTAATPTVTELRCAAPSNATITISISGGTQPYSYTVNGGSSVALGSGVTTISYSTATANTYNFTITDATGCTTTATATVNAITNPTASATSANPSCNNGTDGQVQITGAGGSGGFEYSFNGGAFSTTSTYTNLDAFVGAVNTKNYTYQVRDSKGCLSPVYTITLTNPTKVVASASIPSNTNCSTSTVITVSGAGGAGTGATGDYTYSFNGSSTYTSTNTLPVTLTSSAQTITYSVKDSKGCTDTQTITIPAFNPPTGITFSTPAGITCTATTTSITLTPVGGIAPFSYTIISGPTSGTSSTGTFAGLLPGNYVFEVRDAFGCTRQASTTINSAPVISVAGEKTDVRCFGVADGTATFTITGASSLGNYNYTLTPSAGTATKTGNTVTVTGLVAGTYTLQVTDITTGCSSNIASVTINPATQIAFTVAATNINCNNKISTISFPTLSGGTPGYSYAYAASPSTAPTTAYGSVITVDTAVLTTNIDVYVKDANGCVEKRTVTVNTDAVPTVTALVNNQCTATSNNAFTIIATGTGGVGTLHYSIDGVDFSNTTGTFTVSSRTAPYVVTVKDANGCINTAAAITVYPRLTASISAKKELDCLTAGDNASFTVAISGGRPNYSYSIVNGSGTTVASATGVTGTSIVYNNAAAGTYTINITDANNCTTTTTTEIQSITNPTVAVASQVNVFCFGGHNGSVTLTGSGGSGGFTYSNNATSGFTNNATFNNLTASVTPYIFYVKDSKGCVGQVNVTITQPAVVSAAVASTPLTCSTTNTPQTATITVTAAGGTGAYTYSFDNGVSFGPSNIKTVTNTGASQSFQIIVKDANGCTSAVQTEIIAPLNPPTITSISPSVITCNTPTGTATINVTGGVGTLNYQMISPSVVNNGTNNVFASLLENVNYTFRVTDANGCYDTEILRINPATHVTVAKQLLSNVDCFGGTNGSARFTVSNSVGALTVSLTNSLGAPVSFTSNVSNVYTYSGLTADTYTFTVTDAGTGCSATETVTISQPTAALGATYVAVNANCNVATSRVTVTATDGTPVYRYSFVTSATTPGTYGNNNIANLNPTTSLTWYAHIIDAKGCTFVLPITIASDPVPTVSASAVNQCLGSGSYTITATNTTTGTIVNPVTYSINNGASWQPGNTFTVTGAGDYVIKMKDGNGCIATSNTVTVHPQLTLSAVLDKDITCSAPADAQFTLTVTGGNPGTKTYEYSTNGGTSWVTMTTNVLNTSAVGNYRFRVTDLSTCTATTTLPLSITAPVNPVITGVTQTQFIGCHGDNSAAINVVYNPALGQGPFVVNVKQYSDLAHTLLVQDFGTQTSGLPAGYYEVTVTDAKGCSDVDYIHIEEPAAISFDLDKVNIQCTGSGNSLGEITVENVTGGTGPFKYFITNNFGDIITPNPYVAADREDFTFTIINFGLYTINVVDANGCSLTKQITMSSPPNDLLIDVTTTAPNCSTGGTATVTVTAPVLGNNYEFGILTQNTAPYSSNFQPANSGLYSYIFNNLTPGVTYTFVVHDMITDCYYINSADPIALVSNLKSVVTPNNITCKGENNGSVTFTVSDFDVNATSIDYQIFAAQSNTAISGLISQSVSGGSSFTLTYPSPGTLGVGTYYIVFTENGGANNGCKSASANFDIKESAIDLSVSAIVSKNANCNPKSGVISAIAKDGTAPYTYQIRLATDSAPDASDSAWASTSTFNKDAGSYIVYAKDTYGCIKPFAVTLNADDAPTVTAPAPICYNGTPFTITFSGTVDPSIIGAATYSVNGSAFQATPSFTFNAAGTYNLVIKDGNGCTADVDYVVHPQLELKADLTKELDCTTTPAAEITLKVTGGNPAGVYTYEVNVNGGGFVPASNLYTSAVTGTHVFRVTNDNGTAITTDDCQVTTTITLDPIPVPTITPNPIAVLCAGDSNGSVSIDVTGGVGPYEYSLDGTTFQPENEFTGLAEGTAYIVTVRDAKMCTYTEPFTIAAPLALDADANVTTALQCTTGNAATKAIVTVDVIVGTGTAPYEYSFDAGANYSSVNTFETYTAGVVAAKVKDANGCIFDVSTTVIALDPPSDMNITGTPVYCMPVANQTSTVTINSVTDGVGILSYTMLPSVPSGVTQTGNVFAGLTPGTYVFQVTDANGCTYQEPYTVDPLTPIAIVGSLVNDITCNAANGTTNNGSASYTVTGFSATGNYTIAVTSVPAGLPFTQSVSGDVITLSGLSAGTYTVTVTDSTTGCQASDDVTIAVPAPITFNATATKVYCTQDISQITVSGVTGGTGVYTYGAVVAGTPASAVVYDANPVISVDTNFADLSWDVYVKDANGCFSAPVTTPVIHNVDPTILVPAQQCYVGSDLTVDLSLNTLTTTYNGVKFYTVNGSPIATSIATFTAPGTYVLGIKDDNGCEAFVTYKIENQLLATATLTKDLYCAGSVNATIDVAITDGVAPYTYQMYLDGTATGVPTTLPISDSSFTVSVASAGSYTFEITDSNAATCTVTTNNVIVNTPVVPTFTPAQTNVSCNGGSDGTITIIPADGIAPYTFVLTGAGANNTGNTSGVYTGLPAGSYTVTITDAYGCSVTTPAITITEPVLLTASASFPANTTCSVATVITVVGNGGTPTGTGTGYYYSFNGGAYDSSNTFTVNDNGAVQTITYSVKDASGCTTAPQSIIVNPLNKPTDLAFVLTVAPTCPAPTATVTLTATNGVGGLQYETIAPSAMVIGKQASNVFTGLIPGDYTFQVTDANGCTYQELYKVDPVINIAVTGQLIADMTCNTGDDGKVNFDVSKFSGNYNYTITKDGSSFVPLTTSSATTIPLTGLGFGVYAINITDNTTSCTATASVTVAQPTIVTVAEVSNTHANCNAFAQVKVAGSGGTPGYTYAYRVSGSSSTLVFTTSDSASLDPAVSTTWDFYAKDANGCTSAPITVTIITDSLPAGFTAVATQCPSTTGTYTITVNVGSGMGPFEYSIGNGYQSSTVFTVTTPGTYNLTVKDVFGCTANFPAVVNILQPLVAQAAITALPSCANNDGVIDVTASGGSGNYSYQLDGGTAVVAATAQFINVSSGNHTIVVTDTTTNCTDTVTLNLIPATPVTGFGLSKTDVTCNGGNDGTITATMATPAPGVNDNPVYKYDLTGTTISGTPVSIATQDSPVFANLQAGTYTVRVVSARGCPATATITVIEPAIIIVPTPTPVQFGCTSGNTMNFATITVNGVTGGSGTYNVYEFIKGGVVVQKGTNNTYTESDLSGGSYTVNVYDDKGCLGSTTTPIVINPFISLETINVVINSAITCTNDENITVSVTTTGGTPATLNYTVAGTAGNTYNQTNTTGVFTGLTVGNYTVTVANPVTGCSLTSIHYVSNPNTFELKAVKTSDVICYGSATGAVELTLIDQIPTPTNEAGAFTYEVTGPTASIGTSTTAGPLSLTGLTAGNYTVSATLTNSPYCTVSTTFTIAQPAAALAITETHTEITCVTGNNDGTISASATGGWVGDYQYELVGPVSVAYSTQSNFINLTAGNYTVNVRDSKGCIASVNVVLANPTPIAVTATPSVSTVACLGDKTASITAVASGGQGSNYLYTLNYTSLNPVVSSGPQPTPVFTGLGAGTYTITVTDGWNCAATSTTVTIAEPTKVDAALVLATRQTCLTQSTLTLSATGGTAPYRYSATSNIASSVPMGGNSITFPVGNGTFRYYVWDANGCASYVSNDIENAPLVPLSVDLDIKNAVINCRGEHSGDIIASAKGGLGNYVYTLVDGANNLVSGAVQLTPGNFTQLAAGNYRVNVTSGDCSVASALVTITEPATAISATPVVTNVTCNGNNDGMITVNATGGTGIIKYAIEPYLNQFFVSNVFKELKPGLYDVIAQDENGCFVLMNDIEVTEPTPVDAAVVTSSIRQELCKGDLTGAFSITITGGTAPYSTVLDNSKGTYVPGQFDFTGLTGGDHTVYIKDAQGCTFELLVKLDASVILDPVATIDYQCVSNGPANSVTVSIDPSNVASDVTYSLDSSGVSQGNNVFTNLTPGNHFIMAEHKNGCVDATAPFTIDQVDPLTISLDLGGLNEIVATVTGGSGVYQFSVNGESIGSNNKYIYFRSGDYTFTVTDSYGCSISATKYFEFIDIIIPPIFTPNGDGNNDSWKPLNTENYPDIKFVVYDRYGREVGEFGAGQSWDGKYNGTELPMGDYWYKLRLRHMQDNREFVGHFTLYR